MAHEAYNDAVYETFERWDYPWRDRETFLTVYEGCNTMEEMSRVLSCHPETVKTWCEEHSVPVPSQTLAESGRRAAALDVEEWTPGDDLDDILADASSQS